ncbi:MAG: hypothetical protein ACHP9Y_05435 [Gammaproteobacteria bacterium]
MKTYITHLNRLTIITLTGIVLILTGCSDPNKKMIDQFCIGLETMTDKAERNAQYMQCRKACSDAEFYKMPESEHKAALTQTCNAAKKVGDIQFQPSSGRNWLGVTP